MMEPWRHDTRPGFEDTVTVWSDLAAWIDRQTDTDLINEIDQQETPL